MSGLHTTSTRRLSLLLAGALAVLAACSGSGGDADSTTLPIGETTSATGVDDPFSEAEPVIDPNDYDLEIDDDVIIATDDGEIPPTSTEPPIENTPDAPPPVDAPTTTAAPVALPEPGDIGRIVSLSPTHTESLFALGLGDFVVAVDNESDHPAAAIPLRRDDIAADSSNIDALIALDPDIVIVGDDPTGIVGRLDAVGVPSYSGPQADSLEEVYTQIADIAALVGRPDLADDLVAAMRRDIAAIVEALPPGAIDAGLTVFHEIDPTLFTVGSDSFLSDVYSTIGLRNIAGPGEVGQITQMTNAEVIAADPDVIVLADFECCAVTIDRLAARPGWSGLSAVSDGAVIGVPDALVQRWGPRTVELLRLVAGGVAAAAG